MADERDDQQQDVLVPAEAVDRAARRGFGMTDADLAEYEDPNSPTRKRWDAKRAADAAAKKEEDSNGPA